MAYDYISRGKAKENGYTNTRVFKLFGVSSTGYYNYVARREDRGTGSRQLENRMKAM